jgi:aminoglycoside N3'-acetyltransferase
LVNAKAVVPKNHLTNIVQNHHMQEITPVEDNNEQEAVREYVEGIENNIEYFKEWAAIYKTQRDLARSKVSQLEMKVIQLQHIILQNERMH